MVDKYIASMIGACLFLTGVVGGIKLERFNNKSKTVYEVSVEGDQRRFLNLYNRYNFSVPFVETETGVFRRLDDVQAEELEQVKEKNLGLRQKLEDN